MDYIRKAVENKKICGDGEYTKKCNAWLEEHTGTKKALLTTSCTHALEMAAFLADIQPGDEVIMPSYTFCINGRCICASRCKDRICGYPAGYHEY